MGIKSITKHIALIFPGMLCLSAMGETIRKGDITAELGPDFLLNAASTGGGDFNAAIAEYDRDWSVWIGQDGADVSISGIGWASPAGGTTATQATVTVTYLGADGVIGGGDDVVLGSVTNALNFDGAGTYYWRFDTPLSVSIDDASTRFRIRLDAGALNIRYKTISSDNNTADDVKLSVAGTSVALGDPVELILDGGFEGLAGTEPSSNSIPWVTDNEWDNFDVIRETNVVRSGVQSLRLGYPAHNDVRVLQNFPAVNASLYYAMTYWIRSAHTNTPSIRAEFRVKDGSVYTNIIKMATFASTNKWTPHVLFVSPADLSGHHGKEFQIRFRRMDALGAVFIDDVRLQIVGPSGREITELYGMPPHFQHPNGGYLPNMFPFVDRFGQYQHDSWDEKVDDEAHLIASAAQEEADIAAHPGSPEWTIYGGWENGPTLTATGYFRVQKYQGKWWFVDPLGKLFFSHGMTAVNTDSQGTLIAGREDYYEGLPEVGDPDYGFIDGNLMFHEEANAFRKYGPDWDNHLFDLAHRRLRSWGMNTIAAWSSTNIYLQRRTPYNQVLFPAAGGSISFGFPDYFHPNFPVNVRATLTNAIAQGIGEDPWCLGLFIHNELTWARPNMSSIHDVAKLTLAKPSGQPAKIAFRDMLEAKYVTIGALNSAWGTSYSSWANFLTVTTLPNESLAALDYQAFYALYADTYYRTIREQFDTDAPNTLYLGSRFTSTAHAPAAAASAQHAHVSSYHPYTLTPNVLQPFLDADVPVLIGEWQFIGKDTGLFGDAQRPANPPTQEQRAISYLNYANTAVDHPNLVGLHWFMYFDRSAGGDGVGEFPGANYNTGFMTVANVPYRKVVEASREIGDTMYGRRYGSFPPVVEYPQSSYADVDDPTPFQIPLVITDDTSAPSALTISASSSNTNFIPNAAIAITGTGSNRVLQFTPAGSGHAGSMITIVVTDESGVRSETPLFVMQGRPDVDWDLLSSTNALLSWVAISHVNYRIELTTNFSNWANTSGILWGSDSMTTHEVELAIPSGAYRVQLTLP